MQVGPDIHLLYEGKFYLPDVLAEHKPRLFKDFRLEQGTVFFGLTGSVGFRLMGSFIQYP